jgi:hypothetical protein
MKKQVSLQRAATVEKPCASDAYIHTRKEIVVLPTIEFEIWKLVMFYGKW